MIKKTWKELQDTKLLWWINRSLHLFGWAIVLEQQDDGSISNVYPARVSYRGFSEENEEEGFIGLTRYLGEEVETLQKEVMEEDKVDAEVSRNYWIYTCRCECHRQNLDYCVDKKMDYDAFRRCMSSHPKQQMVHCEICKKITAQTLIAYDKQPE